MQDWRDEQVRYLVHFDGSGSGMRFRDADVGDVLVDAGESYHAVRVEQPKSAQAL